MKKSFIRYLMLFKSFFRVYMKTRLVYRKDFILGLTSQFISITFSIAFLTLIFTQVEAIEGWTFNEMLLLAGLSGFILNLHHIFFFRLYSLGSDYIVTGKLDRYRVRPLSVLFQVFVSKFSDDNLSKFVANAVLIVYAAGQIGLSIGLLQVFYGFFAVISGVMVVGAIFLTLATTAFWTARSKAVFWLFFRISDFRKYPFDIYSGPIKLLLVTFLPIMFMSYFPTAFMLGRDDYFALQLLTLFIGPFLYVIAFRFWLFGLSHYSSTGS